MKRLTLLLFLVCSPLLQAQQQDDTDRIIGEIVQAGSRIKSLECDFVQEKTTGMMEDKLISKGRMSYTAPMTLRWEYTYPAQLAFIMEEGKIHLERDGKTISTQGDQSKMFGEISKLILGCISGKCFAEKKVFKTKAVENDGILIVELTPSKKDMAKIWSGWVMHFDPKLGHAVRIELDETSGDSTVITFK